MARITTNLLPVVLCAAGFSIFVGGRNAGAPASDAAAIPVASPAVNATHSSPPHEPSHNGSHADEHATPPADSSHAPESPAPVPAATPPGRSLARTPAPHQPDPATSPSSAKPTTGVTPSPASRAHDQRHEGHAPAPKPQAAPMEAATPDGPVSADTALTLLREGNQRWVQAAAVNPNIEAARRASLASKGQKPFATIITCADSRVPVERLFDRGVGDLFVIRVAGNVAGIAEAGTIEYGLEHLATPVLVVMGHSKCGAVAAAATNAEVHGAVAALVESIAPAVDRAQRRNPQADAATLIAAAVEENVWQTIFDLFRLSPASREMAASGRVRIIGAVYDIATGEVRWLGEHPWQAELIAALNSRSVSSTADAAGH